MRAVSTLTAIGTVLWMAATSAQALGFGRVSNTTQLGQPLNFHAAVRIEPDETLARECVSAEVVSGENRLNPDQVRVAIEGAADPLNRGVRITTSALIDEPVVTISVTLGCTAKVTRRFVAFIDPPLLNLAQAAPAEAPLPRAEPPAASSVTSMLPGEAPAPAAVRRPDRSQAQRSRPRSNVAPRAVAPRTVARQQRVEPAAAPAARAKEPARQPVIVARAPAGPQLKLETAAPIVARSASAPVAAAPLPVAEPASAAAPDAAAEQLARERERIQLLEQGLAALRTDSQATQKSIATLQARLKEAEAERYANPLVYALAALAALLALAVAVLWWRLARRGDSAQWWAGPAGAVSEMPAAATAPPPSPPLPVRAATAAAFEESARAEAEAPFVPVTMPAPVSAPPAPAVRELTVEELIDLEQQVEFFIVLGQDDAAIDLLMSHVRSDGGASPLPYLKLLEIYRRLGEADNYERIRERFNRRFNAYAPDWNADPHEGRVLADYPEAIGRLQALWAAPVRVMEVLSASLFRRDGADQTFDLPAYRELLFLYSVARDLAEHGAPIDADAVDVFLPLDETAADGAAPPPVMQRTQALDLNLGLAPRSAEAESETAPSALRRSAGQPLPPGESGFVDFELNLPAPAPKADSSSNHW